jgi:GT2 family glycosyltransferase
MRIIHTGGQYEMSQAPPDSVPKVSIVINYFNPKAVPRVDTITTLCLQSLKEFTQNPLEVILSNGSGVDSPAMMVLCEQLGFRYTLSPVPQNFEAIYNHGLGLARGEYVGIMENDIFVTEQWDAKMIAEMQRTGAHFAVPYLTSCDNIIQQLGFPAQHWTFEPTMISHNMMLFDRKAFGVLVPLDTQFNGSHDDLDTYLRLKAANIRMIVCRNVGMIHYRRATAVYNPWTFSEDLEKFKLKYPELEYWDGWGAICIADRRFCRSSIYRWLLRAASMIRPKRVGRYAYLHTMRLEPLFHRI